MRAGRIVEEAGILAVFAALAALGAVPRSARGEPYIAVATGLKCASCHVSPTGGGKRTIYGDVYAQTDLAARTLSMGKQGPWTGELSERFAIGGDVRAGIDAVDTPGTERRNEFDVEQGTAYAEFRAIPGLLTVYADQQFAPGGSTNRELYALLTSDASKYHLKVGRMFLPFGWRLQDDTAFVRQASGINYETPDRGVEAGLELPKWSAQAVLSNGTAGGGETDAGKQVSLSAVYVRPMWRLGASYNVNNADLGDREMQGVFVGARTGPVAWLAEVDYIADEAPGGRRRIYASLLEGNWRLRKGHNLKLSYEFLDPDRGAADDQQERYSLVWEYAPIPLLQARLGVRVYNGIAAIATTNRNEVFAELHAHF